MASALTPAADSEPTTPEIDTTTHHHLSLYKYCFGNMQNTGDPDTDTTFPGRNECILNYDIEGYMKYVVVETYIKMARTGLSIRLGVSQGDVVMLLLPNSENFLFAFLGLAYLGAVSAMGNPLDHPAEVQRKARAVGANLVITTASYVEKVRLMAEEDSVCVVCVEEGNGPPPEFKNRQDGTTVPALFWYADILNIDLTEYLSRPEDIPIKPDDAVAITYSTGSPTTITHRDMIASVAQYADGGLDNPNRYFHTDDVVLCAIPLFHIYSLVSVLCGIRVGAAIVMLPKLGITPMLKLVREHKVTVAPLVPDVVVAMRKSPVVDAFDLSSVKVVMLREAVAPAEEEELQDAMRALMPNAKIGQVFDGMTGAGNITIDLANDPFEIEDSETAEEEIPIEGDEIPEVDTTTDHHLSLYKYCFGDIGDPCILNSVEGYTTYAIAERIEMAGTGLSIHLGVSQGDVVMLLLPNSQYFVFAFLGLAYLGAVSAMGNPLDDPAEVQRKARAVGAKVVITTASYVEKVRLMAEEDGVRVVCVEEEDGPKPEFKNRQDGTTVPALFWNADILRIELTEYLSRREDFPIKPDDAVAITYSTGSPTTITHRDMIASVAQYADGGLDNPNLYFHTDDVVLCAIPLFHIYSLVSVLCGIRVGATIIILPKLGITQMLKLVQEHKITVAPLVPDVVVAMTKSPVVDAFDLSSVKVVMLGEAVAPAEEEELQDAMRALMPNAKIGKVFDEMTGAGNITIDLANDPFEIEMEKLNIVDSETAKEEIPEDVDEIPAESPSTPKQIRNPNPALYYK